jgi:antitoxin HicB
MKHAKTIDTTYVGQDFDAFLAEDGIAAEVEARAIKKVMVGLLQGTGLTQVELAQRMHTSRTQVRRLLDPDNTSITLSTLQRAADVMGHRLVIGFEPAHKAVRARKPVISLKGMFAKPRQAVAIAEMNAVISKQGGSAKPALK